MMATRFVLSTLLTTLVVQATQQVVRRGTPQVYQSCINAKEIALTFDDGPYNYLRNISDQFTAAGAKATFFFNGYNWDCIYDAVHVSDIQYAYAAGHMIGSHTWSHADLTQLSSAQLVDAMYRTEEALSRIIGIKPAFMRPPYGAYNDDVQSTSFSRGQSLAIWDQDTEDADGAGVPFGEAQYKNVVDQHLNNALFLEHEPYDTTAGQLVPYAINLFQTNGYKLVSLAECLGVDPFQAIGLPQERDDSWTCDNTPPPGEGCNGGSIPCRTGTPVFSTAPSGPTATPTSNQYIHPTVSSAKCLTAASNTDGAVVEIEDCVTAGSPSQNWTVSGQFLQVFGDKCLDVTGGANADGTKLQIWTCSTSDAYQQWSLSGSTIQWSGSSRCLDLSGGVLTNDNVVQIWTCTGGANQQWSRTTGPGAGGTTPPPATGHTINPGASSTTCLTAASNADGAAVTVAPCTGSTSQAWTQNGQTLLAYGSMCLDVINGNTANGAQMQIWSCTPGAGDAAQHFTVTSDSQIQWAGQTKCLDLTDGSLTSGNRVQMWDCGTPNANQVWNIV